LEDGVHDGHVLAGAGTYIVSVLVSLSLFFPSTRSNILTRSIVVPQVLAVLVLLDLRLRENTAEGAHTTSDLGFEAAEVGEDRDLAVCECQIPANQFVQPLGDRW
jgi:hypothetical protein